MSTVLGFVAGVCFVAGLACWITAAVRKARHGEKAPALMYWGAIGLVFGCVAMTVYFTTSA
jgi:hypothetical protein